MRVGLNAAEQTCNHGDFHSTWPSDSTHRIIPAVVRVYYTVLHGRPTSDEEVCREERPTAGPQEDGSATCSPV